MEEIYRDSKILYRHIRRRYSDFMQKRISGEDISLEELNDLSELVTKTSSRILVTEYRTHCQSLLDVINEEGERLYSDKYKSGTLSDIEEGQKLISSQEIY